MKRPNTNRGRTQIVEACGFGNTQVAIGHGQAKCGCANENGGEDEAVPNTVVNLQSNNWVMDAKSTRI